jgi:chromosome segregation ATPase
MPRATLKSLKDEIDGLNLTILTLEDELKTYRTQNTSLRTEMQDRSDESDRQILRLQQNLRRVTGNFNNLVAKYNKKSVELDNLEARYNEKAAEVDNLVARYNELSLQLDSYKKKSNNRLGQVILLKAKLQQERVS